MTAIHAILLAGGRSNRMGRRKEWLPLRGEPLATSIARTLIDAVGSVVVVADPDHPVPAMPPGVEVVRDRETGHGPLYGFATGLAAIGTAEVVYLAACDTPFLQREPIRRTIALLGDHHIAVPVWDGMDHPLSAAYRTNGLSDRIGKLLDSGRRRLVDLLDGADVRRIAAEELRAADPDMSSLFNVNTPEDYAEALRRIERAP